MHVVGDTGFSRGGHESFAEHNLPACATCHGASGQGTVLARAAVARTLTGKDRRTISVAKGQPINGGLCHENPYTHH
jgi:cytochrome c553